MSLFQTSVIKKYLSDLSSELIDKKYNEFQAYFGNAERQENIRNSKEEEYQSGFISALFVNILGYTLNPEPNFNIVLEKKNVDDSKKADGAIIRENEVIAVIELKSTQTTNLDSFRDQAFGYKNHNPKCVYIITSNFEKIRLYIHDTTNHLEFDLFNLSKENFTLLWLCFSVENILNDIPLKIKEASVLQEENVTKKLYNDYSKFRKEIFNDIVKNNPEFDKLILFKKTQKLLDRFLFIFFAEDRLLLPPNSISEIVKQWTTLKEDLDEYVPLYDRFKKYFGYLNTGFKGKKYDIFAYNGGLFLPDEILDNIKIDDEILRINTVQLSTYDFETDVDVNILGHIFEHSLGEIETVQAEIAGEEIDSQKTKRKKDGIFYTPKYITKYIVENTVGKLCVEKRIEFGIVDEEYAKGRRNRKKDIVKDLDNKLTEYREWLLNITILDPACGSGAFLNQALEFLIEEHKKIDELKAQLLGGAIVFSDIEAKILEKNIYGVDLNQESVEIAKLSLWLRTAQKGRKLTTLSNHIKCGNSLIDEPEIAGEKAFNWQTEFPEIFEKGGFDIVIGNPPYVKARDNEDILSRNYIEKNYQSPYKMWDLYIPFIEKGMKLIKSNGFCSMIIPDTIGKAEYSTKLVDIIEKDYFLYQIDFFPDLYVFENVGVRSKILFVKKSQSDKLAVKIKHFPTIYDSFELPISNKKGNNQYLIEVASFNISMDNCLTLGDICYVSYGMRLNSDKSDPDKFKKTDLLSEQKSDLHSKLYTEGKYIDRYIVEKNLFLEWNTERCPNKLVRPTFPELYPPEKLLLSRQKRVATYTNLGHYCDNTIIMAIKAMDLKNVQNNSINKYYKNIGKNREEIEANSELFNLKYLLAIINSSLIKYYIKFASKGNLDFYPDDWKRIPIKKIDLNLQQEFVSKVETLLESKNDIFDTIKNFVKLFSSKYNIESVSKKLANWYELESNDFLKELKKNDIILNLSEESEWLNYLNEQKQKISELIISINKTDKAIDQMVYKLYGLTEEDLKTIEESN